MFPTPQAAHRRAALLLAFCAILWSIAGVITRHLEAADGFEITFWRGLFCALTMLAILGWQRRGNPFAPVREMGWPGLFSGAMWGVMFTCFMLALTRTSVANTLLVMSVAPLFAAVLGRIVLGTRVSGATALAILMAGAGIWWMVREGVSADGVAGMAIALAVPVASAINIVTLKRLHAEVDLAPAVLVGAVLCCIATAPLAWPFEASAGDIALLALLGAVQLAIPCFLMIRAVRQLAPHEVALIALLEVVLGPIWAWLGAGEAMPAATIQGGLVVLVALIGDTLLARRALQAAPAAAQPAGLH
ncbi:MAG: hypothetical protein ABS56_05040 [Lautropia sp. SCN 69-89]|nr:MAG: hypothetical protein ABS56_05040 [Lautropia sp. SCN 69-89]